MEGKYQVIHKFKDLKDDDYIYNVGDEYPREGLKPTKKRIEELSGKKNKIGEILIQEKIEVESAETENESETDSTVSDEIENNE